MEFADHIPNYLPQNDENIQIDTSIREEFYQLRGAATESIPKPGEFFKHQNLFARYIRQHDRILNIHETGTGKTGSIINAAEMFRETPLGIKRVVVIEPGAPTLEDFKSQIVKFFPEKYDNDSDYENVRRRMINKKVSKWYYLDTYESFSNKLGKMSISDIEETFSDTLFFFDEAHRMRNYGEEGEDDNIYINIWKMLHIALRTKIVVGSATPLVNSVNDFVPLVNLLLPSDGQLPITKWDYSNVSMEQLEPFFRGKISFVRSLDNNVVIKYEGKAIDYTHNYTVPRPGGTSSAIPKVKKEINEEGNIIERNNTIQGSVDTVTKHFKSDVNIVRNVMLKGSLQCKRYKEATRTSSSFELSSRESATFVFPNGTWGSVGFKQYVKEEEEGRFKFKNEDIPNHINEKGLNDLSSKFGYYVTKELESSKTHKPGNSFCYLEFVQGSGAILLGLVLEHYKFKNYTTETSAFVRSKGVKRINSAFRKIPRFALITSKTINLGSILELFNSPENIDGEYLQIIIASKIARDGINLANVRRGYIMSPGWHEAGMYQALSRFIRATSHELLLIRDKKAEVEIFKLAGCLDGEDGKSLEEIKINSIDMFNYIKSEQKDINNKLLLRDMKSVAFDSLLNYDRNHRETDRENSKYTDYGPKYPDTWSDIKNKGFINPPHYVDEDLVIKNTKKLMYNKEELALVDRIVKQHLSKYGYITVRDIIKISNLDTYYVFLYIKDYVPNLSIEDKFGNRRETRMHGDMITLETLTHHIMSQENTLLPIIETEKVVDLSIFYTEIENMSLEEIRIYIQSTIWIEGKKEETLNKQANIQTIIEDVIISLKNNDGYLPVYKRHIYELFTHYINKCDYPSKSVEDVEILYKKGSSGPGRSAKAYSNTKLKSLKVEKKDTGTSTTYYHFFNPTIQSMSSIFKTGTKKIRILTDNEFKDANIYEKPVFNRYCITDIEKWRERFENGDIWYGSTYRDGKFRIHKPPFDKNTGIVCDNNKALELLRKIDTKGDSDIIIQMNINPDEFLQIIEKKTRLSCEYLKKYITIKNRLLVTF